MMWGHVVRVRWKGDRGRVSRPRINVLTQHGFRAEGLLEDRWLWGQTSQSVTPGSANS